MFERTFILFYYSFHLFFVLLTILLSLEYNKELHRKAFYSCTENYTQFKNVNVKKEEDKLPITIIIENKIL